MEEIPEPLLKEVFDLKCPLEPIFNKTLRLWNRLPVDSVALLLPNLVDLGIKVKVPEGTSPGSFKGGRVVGLVAKRDQLQFSLRVVDPTSVSEGLVDIVDLKRDLRSGWLNLQIDGDLEEEELAILDHPEWVRRKTCNVTSVVYLVTKIVLERMDGEARMLSAMIKDDVGPKNTNKKGRRVRAFELKFLHGGSFDWENCQFGQDTPESREALVKKRDLIVHKWIPALSWYTRAVEFDFYPKVIGTPCKPVEIEGEKWFCSGELAWRAYETTDESVVHEEDISTRIYGVTGLTGRTGLTGPTGTIGPIGSTLPIGSTSPIDYAALQAIAAPSTCVPLQVTTQPTAAPVTDSVGVLTPGEASDWDLTVPLTVPQEIIDIRIMETPTAVQPSSGGQEEGTNSC